MQTKPNPLKTVSLGVTDFDLDAIFDCGQCFRWERQADGGYRGVIFGQSLYVRQNGGALTATGAGPGLEPLLRRYFDLDRDYGAIKRLFADDLVLKEAVGYAPGIRILRQEPWEALCSFIISQNNNIPRIRGILSRLCEQFGAPVDGGFAFPPPQALLGLEPGDLAPLRCGFRARYLLDAAQKVSSGEVDLVALYTAPLVEARTALMKIIGVGPKVAECTLLYGLGRLECFPEDVWIKRVLRCFYPGGFPAAFRPLGGIAQQYLFHYARCCEACGLNRAAGGIMKTANA